MTALGEFFLCIFVIIRSWQNVGNSGRDLKCGCGKWCTFSMGNYFPHDIIIFPVPLGYKKIIHNLYIFAAQNLLVTDMFGVQ